MFSSCCGASSNVGYQVMVVQSNGKVASEKFTGKLTNQNLTNNTVVRKVEKSNYDQLIQQFKGKKDKWSDPQFLPSEKSLGRCPGISTCQWERVSNILTNPVLFEGKIEPKDVLQGNLGDCYFLSALSAISQDDIYIKNVFQGQSAYNENGIYKVLLRINGEIKEIVVDDWIPVNKYKQPLFCQLNKNECWVAILEKAWAKAHGSYEAIIAGLPNEVMRAVTHAPTYTYDISRSSTDIEKLWGIISDCASKDYPMCAGTTDKYDQNSMGGLIPGHAYTLIDAQEHRDVNGKQMRILQLRNPWGKFEWKGSLSDGDKLWNTIPQSSIDSLKYVGQASDDGIFYMLYTDFVSLFNILDICYEDASCSYFSQSVQPGKNADMVLVTIDKNDEYIFELHQPTLRGESAQRVTQGFNRATLILAEKVGKTYRYVKGIMSREYSDLNLKVTIDKGVYVLYCKFDKTVKGEYPAESSVSVYSVSKAKLEPTTQKDNPDFLKKVFLEYSRTRPEKQVVNNNMWIYRKLLYSEGGFGFIAFSNTAASKKKFIISFDEESFTKINFRLKKPYKKKGAQTVEILPGQEIIILARSIFNPLTSTISFPPPDIKIQISSV